MSPSWTSPGPVRSLTSFSSRGTTWSLGSGSWSCVQALSVVLLAVLNPAGLCVSVRAASQAPCQPPVVSFEAQAPSVLGLRQLLGGALRSFCSPRSRALLGCQSEGTRPRAGGPSASGGPTLLAVPQSPEVTDCRFLTELCGWSSIMAGAPLAPMPGSRAAPSGRTHISRGRFLPRL